MLGACHFKVQFGRRASSARDTVDGDDPPRRCLAFCVRPACKIDGSGQAAPIIISKDAQIEREGSERKTLGGRLPPSNELIHVVDYVVRETDWGDGGADHRPVIPVHTQSRVIRGGRCGHPSLSSTSCTGSMVINSWRSRNVSMMGGV